MVFRRFVLAVVSGAALVAAVVTPLSSAPTPTRLLRTPTVSETQIAFAYANNIWVVERAGGTARRVTSFAGGAGNPKFSPDGRTIAFTAAYGGNSDVYVVPAEGGEPKRLPPEEAKKWWDRYHSTYGQQGMARKR